MTKKRFIEEPTKHNEEQHNDDRNYSRHYEIKFFFLLSNSIRLFSCFLLWLLFLVLLLLHWYHS